MNSNNGSMSCAATCWVIAGIGGVVLAVLLSTLGGWGFLSALLAGLVLGAIAGALLGWLMCTSSPSFGDAGDAKTASPGPVSSPSEPAKPAADAEKGAVPAAPVGSGASKSDDAPAASAAPAAPAAQAAVKPSTPLPGQQELAERKGTWKFEKTEAAGTLPASAKASDASETQDAGPAGDAGAVAEQQPKTFASAPASGADDLKLISGIGPKLQDTLNELGIYTFDQISEWGEAEIEWVDARVRFKGRIRRDDWISQAKTLAAGGETEFSKRSKNS